MAEHGLSIRRAIDAAKLSRSTWWRTSGEELAAHDRPIIDALNALVERHPRWGFWRCFDRLRLDGQRWNHKGVYRVYCAMKLNLPRRKKRRVPVRVFQPLEVPIRASAIWSLDIMSDTLYGGRRFGRLNVLDEGVREALKIVIDTSIPSARLVRELERLVVWCHRHDIESRYIQSGNPNQNAFIERFNKTYRYEVLDAYLFRSLDEVRAITNQCLRVYNEYRPHDSLERVPPAQFRRNLKPGISTFEWST